MSRSSSSTARTTDDGRLAALAFNMIRWQSVASVLGIIISEPNPLTPTSTPSTLLALTMSDLDGDSV